MALVFARRLAIPLWAIAFFTVAVTAPPPATLFLMSHTTLSVIAVVGTALIVFTVPSAIPWLRRSRAGASRPRWIRAYFPWPRRPHSPRNRLPSP